MCILTGDIFSDALMRFGNLPCPWSKRFCHSESSSEPRRARRPQRIHFFVIFVVFTVQSIQKLKEFLFSFPEAIKGFLSANKEAAFGNQGSGVYSFPKVVRVYYTSIGIVGHYAYDTLAAGNINLSISTYRRCIIISRVRQTVPL